MRRSASAASRAARGTRGMPRSARAPSRAAVSTRTGAAPPVKFWTGKTASLGAAAARAGRTSPRWQAESASAAAARRAAVLAEELIEEIIDRLLRDLVHRLAARGP